MIAIHPVVNLSANLFIAQRPIGIAPEKEESIMYHLTKTLRVDYEELLDSVY